MNDLISRQAVLDLIPIPPREQWIKRDNRLDWIRATREMIEELPFIEQTQMVLDKIRAEIENHCGLAKENECKYCPYCNITMGVREILEIIDKYKAESEEQ